MIDTCTRFSEIIAMPSVTAESAAQTILNFIGRFTTPKQIKTDQGSDFTSNMIKIIQERAEFHHDFSMTASKEECGIVERANKEYERHLRNFVDNPELKYCWDECLPFVKRIMNHSIHSATGFTPAQMLFGNAFSNNKVPHNITIFQNLDPVTTSEYVDNLITQQKTILRIARDNQLLRFNSRIKDAPQLGHNGSP
jgi:hypothetical protein